jgi:tRNA (mo5U34)-methyltransferase
VNPTLPPDLDDWPEALVSDRLSAEHNGDYPRWRRAVDALPEMAATSVELGNTVTVRGRVDEAALTDALRSLHPWRKGPYQIGNVHIDTEWRSDWKWQRLAPAVAGRLDARRVLDIGCGNGYFGWRMLEAGAREVVGIDPSVLFCMQHLAIQNYVGDPRNHVLPFGIDEVPTTTRFDAVFSMGVLYHRRAPEAHVQKLHGLTAPGGFAVLETLIHEGADNLVPESRYARMRNVWCIPTLTVLDAWLRKAGFESVAVVDVSPTTPDEQRSTSWMRFESLSDALDPSDPTRTVEGHPAPVRAMVVAEKPA